MQKFRDMEALHAVERYRLIDYEAAVEAQARGFKEWPSIPAYAVDPDQSGAAKPRLWCTATSPKRTLHGTVTRANVGKPTTGDPRLWRQTDDFTRPPPLT
jgi:hypothetical protein